MPYKSTLLPGAGLVALFTLIWQSPATSNTAQTATSAAKTPTAREAPLSPLTAPDSATALTPAASPATEPQRKSKALLRWENAELIDQRVIVEADGRIRRASLLEPGEFPYPVQVNETYASQADLEADRAPAISEFVANRLTLRMDDDHARQDVTQVLSDLDAVIVGTVMDGRLLSIELSQLAIDAVPQAVDRLIIDHSDVRYAEPDFVVRINALPNDPFIAEQWSVQNTGQFAGGVPDADLDLTEAWDIRTDASNIIVGVVDTGILPSHEDLRTNLWTNPNEIPGDGIDNDSNGYVDDIHGVNFITNGVLNDTDGHGTHVAGTIGAQGNNGIGVAGMAWDVQLMGLRFLGSQGGSTFDAIEAIDYGVRNGAHILNNSWGGGSFSLSLYEIVEFALFNEVLFVAAAGNSSFDTDIVPEYPGAFDHPNVISVASTGPNDLIAGFSNFGSDTVEIAAPGVSIFSTWNSGNSSYRFLSGTSMAAPHVSGMLALLLAEYPEENPLLAIERLKSSGENISQLIRNVERGRANLNRALRIQDPTRLPREISRLSDLLVDTANGLQLTPNILSLEPLTVQWFRNGFTPIAVTNTLEIPDFSAANNGFYHYIAANSQGQVSSGGSFVASVAAPTIGGAVESPTEWFTTEPGSWQAASLDSATGGDVARAVANGEVYTLVQGPGELRFRWGKQGATQNTSLDFYVDGRRIFASPSSGGLRSESVLLGFGLRRISWKWTGNGSGAALLDEVDYVLSTEFPRITGQPESQQVDPGDRVTLRVDAMGAPFAPLVYFWRKDGVPLPPDSPVLTIDNFSEADVGVYSVTVANFFGTVASQPVIVDLAAPVYYAEAQPIGDGWLRSPWFGLFWEGGNGWFFHFEHGWTFIPEASSPWVLVDSLGWVYTNETTYPFLYSDMRQEWLLFDLGTRMPTRYFGTLSNETLSL